MSQDPAGAEVRLVCVGDSFTEGMSDRLRPDGEHLGWADRVAHALASRAAGGTVAYANLAVRGKLLDQVVDHQLPLAASFAPTLLTFHAGPNDVLRTNRLDDLLRRYDEAVSVAAASTERLVLFTSIGRAGGSGPLAENLAARFARFNAGVRAAGVRHGASVVDLGAVDVLTDRRMWDLDRLHLNPDGHARVAAAVLEELGVRQASVLGGPVGWWRERLPEAAGVPWRTTVAQDLQWARRHLLPWLGRRLRGTSSGDGRVAKDHALRLVVPSRG